MLRYLRNRARLCSVMSAFGAITDIAGLTAGPTQSLMMLWTAPPPGT